MIDIDKTISDSIEFTVLKESLEKLSNFLKNKMELDEIKKDSYEKFMKIIQPAVDSNSVNYMKIACDSLGVKY